VAFGGAQAIWGITPDLTCLGKIIGGGLPLAAYGGRADLMALIAPDGPVYQAGTLSGNPVAVAAGLKTLELLSRPGIYDGLEETSARLALGLAVAAAEAGLPLRLNRVGSMWTAFFSDGEIANFDDAKRCDLERFGRFMRGMLERGVYLAPSQFEANFVSLAHGPREIDETLAAARETLRAIN
jgi:glutamate-1-semialdehyde 2,1-aminomutase